MTEFFYKIKRISDGRFSTGGAYPSFNITGKTWLSEGQLRSHLRMLAQNPHLYNDCKIVSYEISTTEKEPFSLEEIMDEYKQDKLVAKLADKRLSAY